MKNIFILFPWRFKKEENRLVIKENRMHPSFKLYISYFEHNLGVCKNLWVWYYAMWTTIGADGSLVAKLYLLLATLWNPCPPDFSVHRISQARKLEWVSISFSKGTCWLRDRTQVSCIASRFFTNWEMIKKVLVTQLCPTLWPHGL